MRRWGALVAGAVLASGLVAPGSALAAPAPVRSAPVAASEAIAASIVPSAPGALAPPVPGARRYDGTMRDSVRTVLVVSATSWRSTAGRLTVYVRAGSGWRAVRTMKARLGRTGLVLAAQRRQGTGTTPAGRFAITETFGRRADPGTAMPYTKVTLDHWWVQDRRSRYYNQMRRGSQGGFALTRTGYYGSERLAAMGPQYDYAAVIDFNRPRPVIGRGSGIFLHAYGDPTTVGCVSVHRDRMVEILRLLRPGDRPRIIIGEDDWLRTRR
jgi:L,D-peptidoglycan transpeptidase YkuD (ErfK/YbiS/YcfS/YnhG family)